MEIFINKTLRSVSLLASGALYLLAMAAAPAAHAEITEALHAGDTISHCVGPDPAAMHAFKPHCKERITRAGYESDMSYNALGLRDRDYAPAPRKGWDRVLFVGSSAMAAPGLAEKDSPPRKLEARLRKARRNLELINAGVEGYFGLNLAAVLGRELAAYKPTHVVTYLDIGSSMNGDTMNLPYLEPLPDGGLALRRVTRPWIVSLGSLFGLSPASFADARVLSTLQMMGYRAWKAWSCRLAHPGEGALADCMLEPTVRAIANMKSQAERAGSRFLLLYTAGKISNDMHVSPAFDISLARKLDKLTPLVSVNADAIGDKLRAAGVEAYRLELPRNPAYQLPGDYHFSALGAEEFAARVEPRVKEFLANKP